MTPPMASKDRQTERDGEQRAPDEPERERERDHPYTDTDLRQVWPDDESDDDAPSRAGRIAERGQSVAYTLLWPVVGRLVSVFDVFRSSEGRTAALVVIAYVTGIAGLALSFVGDPTAPNAGYGAAGIALMAITFACLFLLSMSVISATGQAPRGGRHGRRDR